jgi:lysophospholipase
LAEAPLGPGSTARRLTTDDGVGLRAAFRPGGGRGIVLLLQGRTEFHEKYRPVADLLAARGLAVATVEWRGQGASDRPIGHPRKGHVGDFAEFQRDLAALLAAPEVARAAGPRIVLAHSMGGAIALRALLSGMTARAAAFSAPMWGLGGGRGLHLVGKALAFGGCALGLSRRYMPGGGGDETYALTNPDPHVLTADPNQARWMAEVTRANAGKALGGPTLGWLRAAYREMGALRKLRLEGTPALVMAGSDEKVVDLGAMRARAANDGLEMREVPGGRHELMFEGPERRAAFWEGFDALLSRQGV